MSGACPECLRAFQRWFVASVHALAQAAKAQDIVSARIPFTICGSRHDSKFGFDMVNSKRAVTRAIERGPAAVNWLAGGLNFSLNDDSEKGFAVRWQPQLCAIASVSSQRNFGRCSSGNFRGGILSIVQSKSNLAMAPRDHFPTPTRRSSLSASLVDHGRRRTETLAILGLYGSWH
jgi:hypothetical protein